MFTKATPADFVFTTPAIGQVPGQSVLRGMRANRPQKNGIEGITSLGMNDLKPKIPLLVINRVCYPMAPSLFESFGRKVGVSTRGSRNAPVYAVADTKPES